MHVTLVSPFDPNPAAAGNPGAHVGGVERVFEHISRNLARFGHDVTLLCSTDGQPGEQEENGVRVVRAPRHATVLRAPVASLARRVPPDTDLVHVPATYPFTTPSVLKRARRLGIPAVLDFHFEPAPGTLVGRAAARAYRQLGPRTYPMADVTVVRSYAYGRRSPSLGRVPEDRWRIVPNGIDAARFHPDGTREGGDYLLFVGRLVPYKGIAVLLRALAHHPVDMPLRIVGNGPLRQDLEQLARRLDVDVEFLGHVADHALARLYRGARLTLLPSVTRQEAFGITLIESMACGTPVVASDLPGVADVARRGGLVAPPSDVNALGRAIRAALASDDLPHGPPLARAIHARYSWEAVTRRLEEVYREVLAKGQGATRAAPDSEVSRRADPGRNPVL